MEAKILKYIPQSNLFMIFQVYQIHWSLNLIFQIKVSDYLNLMKNISRIIQDLKLQHFSNIISNVKRQLDF